MSHCSVLDRQRQRLQALARRYCQNYNCRNTPAQTRPVRARIITINMINPSPPLGQYPQPELYGHAGRTPTKSKISSINRMIPIPSPFSTMFVSGRCFGRSVSMAIGFCLMRSRSAGPSLYYRPKLFSTAMSFSWFSNGFRGSIEACANRFIVRETYG